MGNINVEIGKIYIERAKAEGFELFVLPGENQLRMRHVGQLTHQPSDGTPAGDAAKAQAEQFAGQMRQPSPGLAAAINDHRGAILIALMATMPRPVRPAPVVPVESGQLPGFGEFEGAQE